MSTLKTASNRTRTKLKLVSPPIHHLLSRLRNSIRRHVVSDGLAKMFIWMVVAFWTSLTIDFVPVLFGFDELSSASRMVALSVTGTGLIWIFYQCIFRRVFMRLKNESMAMLVERKYPAFNESLVTSVNHFGQDSQSVAANQMQAHTRKIAEFIVPEVKIASILNSQTLRWNCLLAGFLGLSVIALVLAKPTIARLAAQRLYRLDATPWPRRCNIELVGIKIARQNPVQGISELGQTVAPRNDEFKIARGDSITLLVRAEAASSGDSRRKLPENCRFVYKTKEGSRGNLSMNQIGSPREGFQLYAFDEQPLAGIISDIEFEIRGGDHRIGPFALKVVDQPAVVSTVLACEFPSYIVDPNSGRWTPREISWSGPRELPQGTSVTVRSSANKPLRKVYSFDVQAQRMDTIEVDSNSFEISIPFLSHTVKLEIYLCDDDGLISENPFSLAIAPTEDQPPSVQNQIIGIGTAITPNVRIPVIGSINDDYGIGRAWIEVETIGGDVLDKPLAVDSAGEFDSSIDFLELQRTGRESFELSTAAGSTVSLIVKAEDRFGLSGKPNLGFGDKFTLDVVDANQLLRILERKEVAERRRLEQINLEMADARGFLLRTSASYSRQPSVLEPGDESESDESESDESGDSRQLEIRLLFARRTMMQIDKSVQELLGVAAAFENIRLQLINNRIDSEDRKSRIKNQVEIPLRAVAEQAMQSLRETVNEMESNLIDLEQSVDESAQAKAESNTELAITKIDGVLVELNRVLDSLIKYETQNELLEIVRKMIKQQQEILEKTKQERQRKAFEGLLD